MRLKIPPPIVALVVLGLMWLVQRGLPTYSMSFGYQSILSALFVVCGLFIAFAAAAKFRRSETQIDPRDPTKTNKLVIAGMFRFTRNPMYLGLLLVLSGAVVWWGNPVNIVLLVVFIWYITRFQITPEEEVLQAKFGADYEAYQRKVRRWI